MQLQFSIILKQDNNDNDDVVYDVDVDDGDDGDDDKFGYVNEFQLILDPRLSR